MNIFALFTAIISATVGTSLESVIGGRLFLDEAPQDSEFPYIVFQLVTSTPDKSFTENCIDTTIQFSIYSSLPSAAEVSDILGKLIAIFDDKILVVSGYTMEKMCFQNLVTLTEDVLLTDGSIVKTKHWAVDFSIRLSLN